MPIRATLAGPERVIGGEVQKNEPRIASVRGCTKSLSQRRTGGRIQWNKHNARGSFKHGPHSSQVSWKPDTTEIRPN